MGVRHRPARRFPTALHGVVSYAELEDLVEAEGEVRCILPGMVTERGDRCSATWCDRHACVMVTDWKTDAWHVPADLAPVDTDLTPFAEHFEALKQHSEKKRAADAVKATGIVATPYQWVDPDKIPLRDWLYGRILVRQFISMTVAPGGVGKSSLVAAETMAQVSGRDLLGERPAGRLRVWLWNLEDPYEETQRKIQAAAPHYGIAEHEIGDRLFVDSGATSGW